MNRHDASSSPAPAHFGGAWMVAILILAGAAVYSNSFSVPFIFDDHDVIERNPSVTSLVRSLVPWLEDGSTVAGRPIVNFTLAINYALGGTDVRGYHAVNLAMHLAAGLALFGVTRRLLDRTWASASGPARTTDARPVAFAVALVWLLHPLQTAAVTYVAQRAELLVSLFYLLTLYCFLRAVGKGSGRESLIPASTEGRGGADAKIHDSRPDPLGWSWLSVGACLLGMASKEVMVSAPLMVLLMDRTFVAGTFGEAWRRRRAFYLSLAATWIPLAWLVVGTAGRGRTAGFSAGVSVWDYALTQCEAVVRYLGLALWPRPLVFDHGIALRTSLAQVAAPAAVLVLLICAVGYLLWRRPVAGFVGACFFALLAPSSSVVPVATQTIAEHRMYLPLVTLVAFAVVGLHAWLGRRAVWAAAAWAAALGVATWERNRDYRSDLSIWADTVAKRPESGRAHANLGKALLDLGRNSEALQELEEAVRLRPDLASAHYNLGLMRSEAGDKVGARRHYEAAVNYDPLYPDARLNLAVILLGENQPEAALLHLEEAVRIAPWMAEPRVVLGNTLAQLGHLTEAAAQHEAALRIDPRSGPAHFNYGNVLFLMRRFPQAETQYRNAIELEPGNAAAHYYLGQTLLNLVRPADAARQLEEALALKPDFQAARDALNRLRGSQTAPPGQ